MFSLSLLREDRAPGPEKVGSLRFLLVPVSVRPARAAGSAQAAERWPRRVGGGKPRGGGRTARRPWPACWSRGRLDLGLPLTRKVVVWV